MNHFQLESRIGTLRFSWNLDGLLTEVRLTPEVGNRARLSAEGNIPWKLIHFLDRFRCYLEKGEPLGELPWEHIDRTVWTEFQKKVYEQTLRIPHGDTRTYAWVAARLGQPRAVRAVGQALKRNLFPVLIPCHRVISSSAGLGGFMGKADPKEPELLLKKRLLDLEDGFRNPVFPFLSGAAG